MTDTLLDSEEALETLLQDCRPQEQYTFIMEALVNELPSSLVTKVIVKLKAAIDGIKPEKRYMYLSSCLPLLLKRCTSFEHLEEVQQQDAFIQRLEVLKDLALIFPAPSKELAEDNEEERARKKMQGKVLQSLVSAFLLKLLERAYLSLMPSTALDFEATDKTSGHLKLLVRQGRDCNLEILCRLAKAAAETSPRPILALMEEMDMGDPQGDGGGDLETSPLSLALLLLLVEQVPERMLPHVLPLCISKERRANVLLRGCYVLLCNGEAMPHVIHLGDLGSLDAEVKPRGSRVAYAHRGLHLFARAAALLTPQHALRSASCRWHPKLLFRKVLDALTSTEDVEQKARGLLFGFCASAMRSFQWTARCELYLELIEQSRVDAVIGSVVTLFKDDWWKEVLKAETAELPPLRLQMTKVLERTLSGELQITEGMDTLTATLNILRLIALSKLPQAELMRWPDLEVKLEKISRQVDAELAMVEQSEAHTLDSMKRQRIAMVAHLLSRVREIT